MDDRPYFVGATSEDCRIIGEMMTCEDALALDVWGRQSAGSAADMLYQLSKRQDFRVLAIKCGGNTIGGVLVKDIDPWNRNAELGYALAPSLWGKGLGVRIAAELVGVLFRDMGLHRVYGITLARNTRNNALAIQMGATVEGVLKADSRPGGQREDRVMFGLLARDAIARVERMRAVADKIMIAETLPSETPTEVPKT